ncbi:MAG: NAD(P)-dependent oxidoreductase [Anaerolineae bacterium]
MIPTQTVLVIGGSGFIGRHTVARLAAQGHAVYATHSFNKTSPAIASVTWLPSNLTATEPAVHWPPQCHSLIYLAQSPAWRKFPDGAADVFQVNVAATLRAAEYARQVGAQRFILVSSGTVYTQTTCPAQEGELFNLEAPRSFYAASKLAAELLLGSYAASFAVMILRPFVPYGVGQDPQMLIPQLVRRVREGEAITLHGNDGLQANPVAVADVAETMARCLTLDSSVTLNIAGPKIMTLRQIGNAIGQVLELTPCFETRFDQVPPVLVGDTSRLQATLGWTPQTSFEAGLRTWLHND